MLLPTSIWFWFGWGIVTVTCLPMVYAVDIYGWEVARWVWNLVKKQAEDQIRERAAERKNRSRH
jgi:hypothetical protein